jgi:predicted CoA-binding protein
MADMSAAVPAYPDTLIKSILRSVKTIAMVGASGNSIRPSYFAMMYLLNKGYKIIPVNPSLAGKEILGQRVYASLADVPAPVDMIDIFRESQYAPGIVREALAEKDRLGFKTVWMQLGVISAEAAKLAEDASPSSWTAAPRSSMAAFPASWAGWASTAG